MPTQPLALGLSGELSEDDGAVLSPSDPSTDDAITAAVVLAETALALLSDCPKMMEQSSMHQLPTQMMML